MLWHTILPTQGGHVFLHDDGLLQYLGVLDALQQLQPAILCVAVQRVKRFPAGTTRGTTRSHQHTTLLVAKLELPTASCHCHNREQRGCEFPGASFGEEIC